MTEISTGTEQARDSRGKFLPGQSGNPNGRPRGLKDKRVAAREDLLGPLLPEAIAKLHEAVKAGEQWAITTVVSYSLPKPRPVDPDEILEFEQRLRDLEQCAAARSN